MASNYSFTKSCFNTTDDELYGSTNRSQKSYTASFETFTALTKRNIQNETYGGNIPQYWAVKATKMENLVCPPVIMGFGLIGNFLSFVVMSRKRMRTSSIGIYCMALAVSDTLVCNSIYPNMINVAIFNRILYEGIATNIYLFLSFLGGHVSAWLIVAITVDRFMSVTFPLKAKTICTARKAKCTVAAIVGFFTLFDGINFLGLLKEEVFNENTQMYVGRTEGITKYFNYTWHLIDATIMNLIPSPVIITLNIITVVKLRNHHKKRLEMTNQRESSATINLKDADAKTYVMLLCVTMIFATVTIPYYTWTIYTGYLEHWKNHDLHETARRAFVLFSFIHIFCVNHSINFYIYCLTGRKFRKELKQMFSELCRKCRVKLDSSSAGSEPDDLGSRSKSGISKLEMEENRVSVINFKKDLNRV